MRHFGLLKLTIYLNICAIYLQNVPWAFAEVSPGSACTKIGETAYTNKTKQKFRYSNSGSRSDATQKLASFLTSCRVEVRRFHFLYQH